MKLLFKQTAQLVFELGPKEHVTPPSLLQLHWLPVQFKICCLMHSIHRDNSPEYLENIVRSVAASRPRPGLRSALSTDYACCRAYGPSSASVLSHMRGTHCLKTSVPHQTLQFLRVSAMLKHVIDIGWTSVCLFVRLSVRHTLVLYQNG